MFECWVGQSQGKAWLDNFKIIECAQPYKTNKRLQIV